MVFAFHTWGVLTTRLGGWWLKLRGKMAQIRGHFGKKGGLLLHREVKNSLELALPPKTLISNREKKEVCSN